MINAIKPLIKVGIVFIILIFGMQTQIQAQMSKHLSQFSAGMDYYVFKQEMQHYLDSLKLVIPEEDYYSGGSDYREFKRFTRLWDPRLSPHGDFDRYFQEEELYHGSTRSQYDYFSSEPWHELGPYTASDNGHGHLKGTGPVEFVTIYDDGTVLNTKYMLTGSLSGGLFFSDDTGEHWQNANTDVTWESSGCVHAVFHPSDPFTWYAATSGNATNGYPIFIGGLGGIYRTTNSGSSWLKIADPDDIGGVYTTINKLIIDPIYPDIAYAVTSNGIFKSSNVNSVAPSWNLIKGGYVYDAELKPGSSNVLFASFFDESVNLWKVIKSANYGQTWSELPYQPESTLNHKTDQNITLEVSKGMPEYLYCQAKHNGNQAYIYYINLGGNTDWVKFSTSVKPDFGSGHGFGVGQINGNYLLASDQTKMRMFSISSGGALYEVEQVHHDVEDIVFSPVQSNVFWLATHGGVEKGVIVGSRVEVTDKYNGLGVAMVVRMASAQTNPALMLAGFNHDGTAYTSTPYQSQWNPEWKRVLWGDGMQPLIDNKDPLNMWVSAQWGYWNYSDDEFDNIMQITKPSPTVWSSNGVLNKVNPEVVFRNFIPNFPGEYEEVYRSTKRGIPGLGQNEFISDFASLHSMDCTNPPCAGIYSLGYYTPYNESDYLVNTILLRSTNFSDTWHLKRTTNANATASAVAWQDLEIPRTNTWITDVEFHPQNPDILHVLYSNAANTIRSPYASQLIYRIDYTNPAAPVFKDLTGNLPLRPAYSLVVEGSSNNGIYLLNEEGVFYTNDELVNGTEQEWQLFGSGLPHVPKSEIEINYVSNTLRAGTYGRGIWEIKLPCVAQSQNLEINSNTIWSGNIRLDRNLLIKAGATLTVTDGVRVGLPADGKIMIEPGATLIVDGGILTNGCDEAWQGVEVWGNSNASQYELPGQPLNQGRLVLKNGAIIENAWNAVALWKPDNYAMTGGILAATDAYFYNNKRAIEFMAFDNFHPVTGDPMPYRCVLSNCHFEVNDNYNIASPFNTHITLWEVDGITIRGTAFYNLMRDKTGYHYGIQSIDAGYKVVPYCDSHTLPCPDTSYVQSSFIGFYAGIKAGNSQSSETVYVTESLFQNNGYGIMLSAVDNATVIKSDFNVGANLESGKLCKEVFGIGIELVNCNGYAIEENSFNSRVAQGDIIGVRVLYEDLTTPPTLNEIYNNSFNSLNRANLAEGLNHLTQNTYGLSYECNQNSNNSFDFYITGQGIAGNQGGLSQAAGNTFSHGGSIFLPSDINNTATNHITYYYNMLESTEEPYYYYNTTVDSTSNSNGCPSHFGGGSSEIRLEGLSPEQRLYFEEQYNQSSSELSAVESLYGSLLDGGDTEGMQAEIETAWPEDTWELRTTLLSNSPMLSKEVLIKASDKTEVLPDPIIFEVLAANPDELKKADLIEHLENKQNPLPEYMVEILKGLTNNITYKTLLLDQLSTHARSKAAAHGILLRDMLNDSTVLPETVRARMAVEQSAALDRQLVDNLLGDGYATEALELAALMPDLYGLQEDALVEHNHFVSLKALQADLLAGNRTLMELDAGEISQLETILVQSTGRAGIQARNMLAFAEGYTYCDCPTEVDSSLKQTNATTKPFNPEQLFHIEASPNPAKHWVSITYELPIGMSQVVLEVADATGRLLGSEKLNNNKGQSLWDIRGMPAGIYYYRLSGHGFSQSGKLVITE